MIRNSAGLAALFIGFQTVFNKAFEGAPSDFDKVAMTVPSTTGTEQYAWLGTSTRFREWLGDRVVQNLEAHTYSIRNKSFENTVGVPRDAIDDDTYGVYNGLIAQLGQDAKTHPDELIFPLLAAGFDTKCYDGQNFFDEDHAVTDVNGDEQSVSNMQTGASTPWFLLDTSKMIRPLIFQKRKDYNFVSLNREDDENVFMRKEYIYGVDGRGAAGFGLWQMAYASKADLTTANYGLARAAMMGMQGDKGKPLGIRPTLLVVPPSLEKKAFDVIKAERLANGASNTYQNTAEILVTPWLV